MSETVNIATLDAIQERALEMATIFEAALMELQEGARA
jgi:hypothetical protein